MSSNAERQRKHRDRQRGAPPRTPKPCGTIAAARRHQRAREPLCPACAAVWAEHQARMYQARKSRDAPF